MAVAAPLEGWAWKQLISGQKWSENWSTFLHQQRDTNLSPIHKVCVFPRSIQEMYALNPWVLAFLEMFANHHAVGQLGSQGHLTVDRYCLLGTSLTMMKMGDKNGTETGVTDWWINLAGNWKDPHFPRIEWVCLMGGFFVQTKSMHFFYFGGNVLPCFNLSL